jgi:hypothetical protein
MDDLDFFISYTGRDQAWATWVAQRLELAGYRTILQAWDFRGNFLVDMEDAVRRAKRLIAILSEPYLGSKWGREEWAAYLQADAASIIPVQIEEINSRSLLRQLQRVNLVGRGAQAAEQKLLEEIRKLAGSPAGDPLDRQNGVRVTFPEITYPASAGPASGQHHEEALTPTVPVDPDHIELVLMGDGAAAEATAAFFHGRLGTRPDRCLNLIGAGLAADEQLGRLAALVGDLDPEAVSDLLVVFAGAGSKNRDAGVRLNVPAAAAGQPATSFGLTDLLSRLQDEKHRVRSYVILDVTDDRGQPVGPADPTAIPVLRLGGQASGAMAGILAALDGRPEELAAKLSHWGPLSLLDLSRLAGGELIAQPDSPAHHVGLIPSSLAWPRAGSTDQELANWCVVLSETDARPTDGLSVALVVEQLANQSLGELNREYNRISGLNREYRSNLDGITLDEDYGELRAADLLSSPRSFAHAVEQVCRADLAVFDLTNFEPAVMILLGIRAVIRRGLTVCVAREHDAPWRQAEPPFHLREVSLIMTPDRDTVRDRIKEGIRQLAESGGSYRDLPCFDLIRDVPPDADRRRNRAFDDKQNPSILALVPFDPRYAERNWAWIVDNLPATAGAEISKRHDGPDEPPRPALQRTLDLKSPRVVSAQLFEAIRLTDFCLVDLTTARPNVLFELGVRLAASRLHPVVIVDREYPLTDEKAREEDKAAAADNASWLQSMDGQLAMARRLLQPVPYSPKGTQDWAPMVERHVEFRRLLLLPEDPRADALLGGLPPTGVYDIAWPHAAERDEVVTIPVEDHLRAAGQALLVDGNRGERHLIYPVRHHLTDAAEKTGREYLIAAWLYLHFRAGVNNDSDEGLAGRYKALTDELWDLLTQTGDQADADFAERIERWRADQDWRAGQQTDGEHG